MPEKPAKGFKPAALTVILLVGLSAAAFNCLLFVFVAAVGDRVDASPPALLERMDFWMGVVGVTALAAIVARVAGKPGIAAVLAALQVLIVPAEMLVMKTFT